MKFSTVSIFRFRIRITRVCGKRNHLSLLAFGIVSLLLDTRARTRLILAVMSSGKTTFGLTLSNRAVITKGTQPKDLVDMAVRAEASRRLHAVWVGDSIL